MYPAAQNGARHDGPKSRWTTGDAEQVRLLLCSHEGEPFRDVAYRARRNANQALAVTSELNGSSPGRCGRVRHLLAAGVVFLRGIARIVSRRPEQNVRLVPTAGRNDRDRRETDSYGRSRDAGFTYIRRADFRCRT